MNWRQYEGAVKGAIEGGNMTQINVAGQKYTDAQPMLNDLLTAYRLIAELRRDLDSTAKIQGDMLKREIDYTTDAGILKADVAYIKNRLSPAEKAVGNGNETPPAWGFLTKKYT